LLVQIGGISLKFWGIPKVISESEPHAYLVY
jgi:hypothetical protein